MSPMTRFGDYATKYQTIRMDRRDGILQMTFHTSGGPLQWGLLPSPLSDSCSTPWATASRWKA